MNAFAMLRNARRAGLAAGFAVAASHATAATATATFQVTANVQTQCTVSAVDLGFGTVDPLGANVDQSTTVTVRCTKNTPYTVGLRQNTSNADRAGAARDADALDDRPHRNSPRRRAARRQA